MLVTVTVCAPAPGPSVHMVVVCPLAFVAVAVAVSDPPPVAMANVTLVPGIAVARRVVDLDDERGDLELAVARAHLIIAGHLHPCVAARRPA